MSGDVPPRMAVEGPVSPDAMDDLGALLDRSAIDVAPDVVPPMWHAAVLLPCWPIAELGEDGHPVAGIPAAPGPGYRRMFAGGATRHLAPIRVGGHARRETTVLSSTEKCGRSGLLRFVTVRHTLTQGDAVCVVEDQDIVYRASGGDAVAAAPPRYPADPAPRTAAWEGTFAVDPVLLFRFSCVTRNAHRIHYDRPYAAREGYSDIVIHGPLQILLMAEALGRLREPFASRNMRYRLTAPAVGPQDLLVRAGAEAAPWAEVRDSTGTVTATAALEDVAP